MAKKTVGDDRRARVAEMQKAQAAADRRRTLLVLGSAVAVVVVLVAVVVFVVLDYTRDRDPAAYGVSAAAADCDPVESQPAEGVNQHVGPGIDDTDRVDYETVPPSYGPHYAQPQFPAAAFYTAEDRPRMEALVHNLEHGYTIVWYAESLPEEQQEQLREIADRARDLDDTAGKFIVSAWDESYGELPEDKPVALSHWGVETGHRQLCGEVSGEVIADFIAEFPYSDSPEPNAA